MSKIVKLSEIKTKAANRRRKEMRSEMKACLTQAEVMEADGYIVILMKKDGDATAYWDTQCLGINGVMRAEYAKRILERAENGSDVCNIITDIFEE
mgnify:FL=1